MTLRRAHRLNAIALAAFILLHLANHLFIFAGADAHLTALTTLRQLYRLPGVEHLIFALFTAQIALGLTLAYRARTSRVPWRRVQKITGIVIAVFLTQHLIAVLATRMIYANIDTNTFWAAAVVSRAPFTWYFVPYYIAGLAALLIHITAALRPSWPRRALALISVLAAILIIAGFMGAYHPVTLPAEYEGYLSSYWGLGD
jgi:succinate dehydrogenase/fumarate reductase cytochrome b subunit